ncbi:DNA polymerase III subunit beta [Candidatus Palibaumannia cicadellinicola]|uniref:Beta sliding clamp n=1 Tax=Candidatus Palibaumannia cicadellinicola TaxID=186490 RepID=A0A088N102_9GAMM|nr:DNA polymerase III subunit beta [Candidatus Baumannia cicadellinicola]AIN47036.1 DNA polymerase III beta subunit [Candidatus Baumannia cicadellinicola]
MKFIVKREDLLKPLQQVSNRLSSRHNLLSLSYLLLEVTTEHLLITGTNLEIEIVARVFLKTAHEPGVTTVCARKLLDICRYLPEGANIIVTLEKDRILVRSGRSRFSLMTLPATNFPHLDHWESKVEFTIQKNRLKQLIESTQFSMAHQDVRYYLNGLLFETEGDKLRTVATDGHRLAACTISVSQLASLPYHSVIIPRKGVIELLRILDSYDDLIQLKIGSNNILACIGDYIFTSKLINGSFPDYHRVLPKNTNKILQTRCDVLKHAFTRVAILSNDKFRGVRLSLKKNQLKITANNLEQEEAEEILDVYYEGDQIEVNFNVNYILDILNVLKCENVRLLLTNEISGVQIEDCVNQMSVYVVMPMRL